METTTSTGMLTAAQVAEKLVTKADIEIVARALDALASDDLMKFSSGEIMAKLDTLETDVEGMRRVEEGLSQAAFTIWCPGVKNTPGEANFTLFS